MTVLKILNPFNAPVYYEKTVTSTMDVSRSLAGAGEPHGTVITADFQDEGRGRGRGRLWQMERGKSLAFTILLRYAQMEDIPRALSLKAGLAAAAAVKDFLDFLKYPPLDILVKWPNDIMINSKKAGGILCEADGGNARIGIGINLAQNDFPAILSDKAVSISLASGREIQPEERHKLLEMILSRLFEELEAERIAGTAQDWKTRLENRLYKKGEKAVFAEGEAGSGREVTGLIKGICETGELLIIPEGEKEPRSFITGELRLF